MYNSFPKLCLFPNKTERQNISLNIVYQGIDFIVKLTLLFETYALSLILKISIIKVEKSKQYKNVLSYE